MLMGLETLFWALICILQTLSVHIIPTNGFKSNNNTAYNFSLLQQWQGTNFFNGFNFFTGADPTNGFVNYVNYSFAKSQGLIKTSKSNAYMYADSYNIAKNGRNSIRIESKTTFSHGLFILSLNHMPEGCGTWPAFWSYGPDWPKNGEIDVIEGVNLQVYDQSALHTSSNCSMKPVINNITFNGQWGSGANNNPSYDCNVNDDNQYSNQGCAEYSNNGNSYGVNFNSIGGGYYVLLWDNKINNLINIWYFNNSDVPSDINSNQPSSDPLNEWGIPNAQFLFGDNCPISKICNQTVTFDLTFCGDWAGNVWSSDNICSQYADTCEDFVANNATYFVDAYWDINFLRIFEF